MGSYLKAELLGSLDSRLANRLDFIFYAEGLGKKPEDKNRHTSLLKTQPATTVDSVLCLEGFAGHNSLHLLFKIKLQQDVLYIDMVRRLPNFGFLPEEEAKKLLRKKEQALRFGLWEEPRDDTDLHFDKTIFSVPKGTGAEFASHFPPANSNSVAALDLAGESSIGLFRRDPYSNHSSKADSRGLKRVNFANATKIINGESEDASSRPVPDKTTKRGSPERRRDKTTYQKGLQALYSKIESFQ